jgi:asparagine synthase (glutamine-hydrolysing)
MCRIVGILNPSIPVSIIQEMVTEMCNLQKHGGPDDAGIYHCPETSLVLGHRRLAILDLSTAGHQPMIYRQRFVISFNGEIYNFPELKKELEQLGSIFHTNSDTEVILAAFEQWNTQSFGRLSGMFAFALYDFREKNLYLVRDPSGIKPLYYRADCNSIEFASEIRAFKALGNKRENEKWPIYQLAYGHLPEPVTTLYDVIPLHKGCFYKFNVTSGKRGLQSFAHYSFSNNIKETKNSGDGIKMALKNAVARHLLSDAPIGVFLSGGIDSGIVTNIASDFQQQHLKTLSLYFEEQEFSEKIYQDSIIDQLKCKNFQHLLKEDEFQKSFPAILDAMDMPSCDGINTWFISKYAKKEGLKAVLSGIGGDELFGGYPSFGRISLAKKLQLISASYLRMNKGNRNKMIKRLSYLSLGGFKGLFLFLRGQFVPFEIADRLGSTEKEIWNVLSEHPSLPERVMMTAKNEASWMELNIYMQNQLLRDVDVMGMAHGVEIRVPFLDEAVIKIALSIKSEIKYEGPLPKQLLIDTFKERLPENVWKRKKMGFALPFAKWLANNDYVKDTMLSGHKSQLIYKKFQEGKIHWSQLLSLVLLQNRGIA